jgi:hypothetical protein
MTPPLSALLNPIASDPDSYSPGESIYAPGGTHAILQDLLDTAHDLSSGRFTSSTQATIVRQLYLTFLRKEHDWIKFFLKDEKQVPNHKSLYAWLERDVYGGDRFWSLNKRQRRNGRVDLVNPGAICGRVMQRFERSYTCK